MRKLTVLFLLLLLGSVASQAQSTLQEDAQFLQKTVSHLAAAKLHGRGYVKKGQTKAAKYLKRQLKKMNVAPLTHDYAQTFQFPVNTFPGKVQLTIGDKKLNGYQDFLLDPSCPGISGTFPMHVFSYLQQLPSDSLMNTLSQKWLYVLLPDSIRKSAPFHDWLKKWKEKPSGPKGILISQTEKFTWWEAQEQSQRPVIYVHPESVPFNPQSLKVTIEAEMKKPTSQNLIAQIPGTKGDSTIVLMAHYDHLGIMGKKVFFPGANDNASGTSVVLDLARYFQQHPLEENVVILLFTGEETGLLGSQYFMQHPTFDLRKISLAINFDINGTGRDGIKVVNGAVYTDLFDQLKTLNEKTGDMKGVFPRGKACNSDHCVFTASGIKAFYIYTLGGARAYHDPEDVPGNLEYAHMAHFVHLMRTFLKSL